MALFSIAVNQFKGIIKLDNFVVYLHLNNRIEKVFDRLFSHIVKDVKKWRENEVIMKAQSSNEKMVPGALKFLLMENACRVLSRNKRNARHGSEIRSGKLITV